MHAATPNQEFIRFLIQVEAAVPGGKVIHVVLDNYAAHKHPRVRAWLSRHPRWVFHFTPTSASWINAVEGFFCVFQASWALIPRDRGRRFHFIVGARST